MINYWFSQKFKILENGELIYLTIILTVSATAKFLHFIVLKVQWL